MRFESKTGRAAPAPSNLKSSRRCMETPVVDELRGLISLRATVFCSHFASGAERGNGLAFGYKFHGYIPIKAQLAQLAEDIWIVDLTGTGVVTAGHVGDVDNADEIEILCQLG